MEQAYANGSAKSGRTPSGNTSSTKSSPILMGGTLAAATYIGKRLLRKKLGFIGYFAAANAGLYLYRRWMRSNV